MKTMRVFASIGAVLLLAMAGCINPITETSGSLAVSVGNDINAKTLTPAIDMDAASFTLTGVGPGSATFSITTSSGTVTVDALAFGRWTVTVSAFNAAGTLIGQGEGTTQVHTGETTVLVVRVTPLQGTGTLDLAVDWNAEDIDIPSLQAILTPALGTARTLPFTLSDGHAEFSADDIPTGYHTLTLQLLDNGIVAMGAVQVVRIVKDQETSGTFAFPHVNKPGGSIQVSITPDMQDPITVSISGIAPQLTQGGSFTASASVPGGTGNVVYVWYLNGASYRVDVTAFTANGKRAGSATVEFQVVQAPPFTVVGFSPWTFDVSSDGAMTVVGTNQGAVRVELFNPDGSVRKPAFTVATADTAAGYSVTAVDVARSRVTGESVVAWSISDFPNPNLDWQNWVAFLDSTGSLIAQPRLLDPAAATGVNRYASAQISDAGVSAFIYNNQTADVFRLVICNPDGSTRAALDVGDGVFTGYGMGRAIGMKRDTGDIIVAGESYPLTPGQNTTTLCYQRFTAYGVPVDPSPVVPSALGPVTPPWSGTMLIDYNDAGYVAFSAIVNASTASWQTTFLSPSMTTLATTPVFGMGALNDRIVVASNGDFLTSVFDWPRGSMQRYTPSGQLVSTGNQMGRFRLDGADNLYELMGQKIQKETLAP